MIKEYPQVHHRRNKSELPLYLTKTKKVSPININKKPSKNNKRSAKPNLIHTLINKSSKKVSRKQIFIENIQQYDKDSDRHQFFYFGKGVNQRPQPVVLEMQEIVQVPDTGSYSQRNTDQDRMLNQNKQNMENYCNYPLSAREKHYRTNFNKLPKQNQNYSLSALNYRERNNCSRKSSHKSSTSQTKSTIQFNKKRAKNSLSKFKAKKQHKSKDKNHDFETQKAIKQKISDLQKNMKLLWQCLGDLMQKNRTYKLLNQRKNERIIEIQQKMANQTHERSQKQFFLERQISNIKIELINMKMGKN